MNPYLVSVRRFLKEEIMGLLALCALTCVLIPLFFSVGLVAFASLLDSVPDNLLAAPSLNLLAMNILGAPWSLTLPQVGFFTLLANVFCLYYFAIKGWLR